MNFLEILKYIKANTAMYRELLTKIEPINLKHIDTVATNIKKIASINSNLPAIHTVNAYKANIIKLAKLSDTFLVNLNGNMQRVLKIKDAIVTVSEYKDYIASVGRISTTILNLPITSIKRVARIEQAIELVSKHTKAIEAYTNTPYQAPKALKQLELLERKTAIALSTLDNLTSKIDALHKIVEENTKLVNKMHSLKVTVDVLPDIKPTVEYIPNSNMLHFTLPKAKDGERGAKGNRGDGISYDAIGTIHERMYFNNRLKGFKYLAIDTTPITMYIKVGSGHNDWKEFKQWQN